MKRTYSRRNQPRVYDDTSSDDSASSSSKRNPPATRGDHPNPASAISADKGAKRVASSPVKTTVLSSERRKRPKIDVEVVSCEPPSSQPISTNSRIHVVGSSSANRKNESVDTSLVNGLINDKAKPAKVGRGSALATQIGASPAGPSAQHSVLKDVPSSKSARPNNASPSQQSPVSNARVDSLKSRRLPVTRSTKLPLVPLPGEAISSKMGSPKNKGAQLPPKRQNKATARDFADLFDFSLASISSPPHKSFSNQLSAKRVIDALPNNSKDNKPIIRRMLGRAKTEAVLPGADGFPLAEPHSRSVSPIQPHARTPTPPLRDPSPSPTRPPLTPTGNKNAPRTYAGPSRSFLVALPSNTLPATSTDGAPAEIDWEDFNATQSQSRDLDVLGADAGRESYASLRQRWGVDASDDDPHNRSSSPPLHVPAIPAIGASKGKGRAVDLRRTASASSQSQSQSQSQEQSWAPALPPNMFSDLKSITELRSKGESRRFMDELGYLFEGLVPDSPISVRRSSATEFLAKFCSDEEFARTARTADILPHAWDMLTKAGAGSGDAVLDVVASVFVGVVAHGDERDAAELVASRPGVVTTLLQVLAATTPRDGGASNGVGKGKDMLSFVSARVDDATLRRAGITRQDKAQLLALLRVLTSKSGLKFLSEDKVSLTVCASAALSCLPPAVLPPLQIGVLEQSLCFALGFVRPRLAARASGLALIPIVALDQPDLAHILNCLRLLDSYLLDRWKASIPKDERAAVALEEDEITGKHSLTHTMGNELLDLVVFCQIVCGDTTFEHLHGAAHSCIDYSLRILVNLTHTSAEWCDRVVSSSQTLPAILRAICAAERVPLLPAPVDTGGGTEDDTQFIESPAVAEEHATRLFDRLCLALALLTNLIQEVEAASKSLRETFVDPACTIQFSCAEGACTCPDRISALACLARAYTRQASTPAQSSAVTRSSVEDAAADASAGFVRGHLAVLFGMLMRLSEQNRRSLLSALSGEDDAVKLEDLIDHASAFVKFYTAVSAATARQTSSGSQKKEAGAAAVDGLEFLQSLRNNI